MIYPAINKLVLYGIDTGLLSAEDRIYALNRILEILGLDSYEPDNADYVKTELEPILAEILNYGVKNGLIEDNITSRDLFGTKIMGCLTPRPSEVINKFNEIYRENSPQAATDYFYRLSCDTDYIRRYRISKDLKWKTETEYGKLDITINLSKPEKDSQSIAAALSAKQSNYPKCLLCEENVGYAGNLNHPARQNHRIIPVEIYGERWGFQYSPYVYYNEHCILFNCEHTPMRVDSRTFRKLFDFTDKFPHYFMGSNAGLPIVGGSILSHEHFQGGRYTFAMETAPVEKYYPVKGFDDVKAGRVKWPMSVIRLQSPDSERLLLLAGNILDKWRGYTDESVFVFAETKGELHNTVTPIARKKGGVYELDLVLRNNITTDKHPLGLYHPHEELHHIKKENIGLIEVMGLAVLPPRLKTEMEELSEAILSGKNIRHNERIEKHALWAENFIGNYPSINRDNINDIIKHEIGLVFLKVLEHAGVFKRDRDGINAFDRFIRLFC